MLQSWLNFMRSSKNVVIGIMSLIALSVVSVPGNIVSGPGPTGQIQPLTPDGAGAPVQGPQQTGPGGPRDSGSTQGPTDGPGLAKLVCAAGRNGGPTDTGVSADRIDLAATNVRSGQGESFLGTAWIGMQAVVNRVNAQGGICGRRLRLRLVDDGWDAPRGAGYLKTFTKQPYFALPVVPSSEGLTVAIQNGTIRNAGIPVVGSDGMLKEQYGDSWVWPVATATVSQMRAMARYAIGKGAKTCGIVFDSKYKFGREGANAFKAYANRQGCKVEAFIPIQPGLGNYGGDINAFNNACNPNCDLVAMLLEPGTASTWIAGQPFDDKGRKRGFGGILTSGAQPLFNERFARDCGPPCDEMLVWTGYNPPIGRGANLPGIAAYVNDVRAIVPDVDATNQFLQGAYVGMMVLVEALKLVGPGLTRERLRAAMNSMSFKSDLVPRLQWGETKKFANCSAQPFRIVMAGGSFAGFGESNTGFVKDPNCGKVL